MVTVSCLKVSLCMVRCRPYFHSRHGGLWYELRVRQPTLEQAGELVRGYTELLVYASGTSAVMTFLRSNTARWVLGTAVRQECQMFSERPGVNGRRAIAFELIDATDLELETAVQQLREAMPSLSSRFYDLESVPLGDSVSECAGLFADTVLDMRPVVQRVLNANNAAARQTHTCGRLFPTNTRCHMVPVIYRGQLNLKPLRLLRFLDAEEQPEGMTWGQSVAMEIRHHVWDSDSESAIVISGSE